MIDIKDADSMQLIAELIHRGVLVLIDDRLVLWDQSLGEPYEPQEKVAALKDLLKIQRLEAGYMPNADTCYIHMRDEVWDRGLHFMACFECGHVYETERELQLLDSELAGIDPRPSEQILSCPLCMHDF